MKKYIVPVIECNNFMVEGNLLLGSLKNEQSSSEQLTRQKSSWDAAAWEDEDEMDLVEE